jgi:hypothetical protein
MDGRKLTEEILAYLGDEMTEDEERELASVLGGDEGAARLFAGLHSGLHRLWPCPRGPDRVSGKGLRLGP